VSSITDDVEQAAAVLAAGGLVAFPTETVYGLGADATDPTAVGRIFAVKGRPTDHPVIVHLAEAANLDRWAAVVSPEARVLAAAFWPGPLTLLVERNHRVPDAVTGGRPTVGLRVPDHPVAHALLVAFGVRRPDGAGIAAPSANRFGKVSPTTAAHVQADLGADVDLILDGGPCTIGIESTIVDCTGPVPEVLRLGGIGIERITRALGMPPSISLPVEVDESTPDGARTRARAPGMLASHYAPRARVEVIETASEVAARAAALVAQGLVVAVIAPRVVDGLGPDVIELEPAGPADDYARALYARLRQADRLAADVILAVPPPAGDLGDAVRDRHARACP
jgi:L-threonylcarbamoyladenylate synthase